MTPPDLPGWTVTRHGHVLFVYSPAGEYVGAVGRVRTGPHTGRWWIAPGTTESAEKTYSDRDTALAALRTWSYSRKENPTDE